MRIPDENYRPPKSLMFTLAAVLIGIVIAVTYYNFSERSISQVNSTQTSTLPAPQRHVLATRPGESALDRRERERKAEQSMRDGWELVDKRDPEDAQDAISIFQDALTQFDPDNPQFYNGIGRASLILGKPQDAIDAFQKGLAVDPAIADMQSGIGWAYWQLHEPYLAKQAWEKALRIDPNSQDAWSAMAWIYLALGDNSRAKQGFQVLVDARPGDRTTAAVQGLSMSRSAVPVDPKNIEQFFHLPTLASLTTPPAAIPATTATSRP